LQLKFGVHSEVGEPLKSNISERASSASIEESALTLFSGDAPFDHQASKAFQEVIRFSVLEANLESVPERRRCLRQTVRAPAFASFDGVSGGMILDLSEEGLSMQTNCRRDLRGNDLPGKDVPSYGFPSNGQRFTGSSVERGRRVRLEFELPAASAKVMPSKLETTGYIAWADALGRAGVRFSDLPVEARERINQWLTVNAGAPSQTAPKVALGWPRAAGTTLARQDHVAISLEAETATDAAADYATGSATVQYEFNSLGTDLAATLRWIGERARSLTRGSSAAIALEHKGAVICRASVGHGAPALGTRLDVSSGFSGECYRGGKALRCDDTECDPRVDLESCHRLGVRSMVAAPVRYERDTIGLLMVMATEPFNFDEGDVAVVESLANTVVRSIKQASA
jgi:GAF domain